MNASETLKLRQFMRECLADAGDAQELTDESSLFISGRLDSLAMTKVLMYLEESFGVDFAKVGFDVERVDSIRSIEALVDAA